MTDCCLEKNIIISEQVFKNGTVHHRQECSTCNKFLGFKQKPRDVDTTRLHFGKHKGMLIKEIPRDYLSWLVKESWVKDNVKSVANKVLNAGIPS